MRTHGARVLGDGGRLVLDVFDLAVLDEAVEFAVVAVLVLRHFVERLEAVRLLELSLVGGDERGEHSGKRVDLMSAQLCARLEVRRPA